MKKILVLTMVVALVAALVLPMAALASNHEAGQNASTSSATTISINDQGGTVPITTISFPQGAPSAVISNPSSDASGGENTPQFLDGAASEPVVQLYNGSAGTLTIWLGISSWTEAVASERYVLSDPATTTTLDMSGATAVTTTNTDTGSTINNGAWLALYLEVTLIASSGKSGTSTLTILGETP